MERETPEAAPPATFLRGEEASSDSSSARGRFERLIRRVQAEVCAALEAVEDASGGGGVFREDAWTRPGGGGGISRVLQGGRVFEKAAVNVSVVYGVMPPDAYRAARPDAAAGAEKAGPVPFFAAGVSSVIHPNNPFAPTLHFNYRYFETEAPQDAPGAPRQWWFGGGTDLTPSYIIEEDIKHFHAVQKQVCDKFDPAFYPRFKKWCDDYFHIKGDSAPAAGVAPVCPSPDLRLPQRAAAGRGSRFWALAGDSSDDEDDATPSRSSQGSPARPSQLWRPLAKEKVHSMLDEAVVKLKDIYNKSSQ